MSYDPIPQFHDRAIGWLLESVENMLALIEIVSPEIAQELDPSSLRMIESSLISNEFRKIEEDMVYEARLRTQGCEEIAFVVIVAHQSKRDSMLSFRILNAMVKLWERELRKQAEDRISAPSRRLRPVVPIVISTCEKPWAVPRLRELVPHHPALAPFVPDFKLAVLDLASVSREEILRHHRPLASILCLFQAERAGEEFEAIFSEALASLKDLSDNEESLRSLVWFCVQFAWFRRPDAEWPSLSRMISRVVGEKESGLMTKTFITMAERVSMAERASLEAREEGREEGVLIGQRRTLQKLLLKKFPEQSEQSLKLKLEDIKDLNFLLVLTDRIFEDLSWDEFWAP